MNIRVGILSIVTWLTCISIPAFGSISLSPAQTDLSYNGIVQLTASVASGASADIDIFFDSNQNGSIDSGEIVWRHYTVSDGQPVPPTGAPLVTDTDGQANGTIKVPIMNFAVDDRIAGHFVVRVKSGSSTSQATFINAPPSTSQSVSGQLLLAGTGKSGAAFLLDGGGQMIYPILTDASGKYTLPVPAAGNYQVGGVILNEAGRENSGVAATIASGQKKTGVNVSFSSAPYRLKGKVVRSDNSQGVPSAWIDADNEATSGWVAGVADSSGNFDIGLSNGTWKIRVSAMGKRGFVSGAFTNGTNSVTINGATLTGKNYIVTPLAGFVSGRAKNGSTNAYLAGATLAAAPSGTYNWVASAVSDQNGYWALGLTAGQWDICPQLNMDTDLYKTMLYPSVSFTKTIATGQAAQNVGTINFLPADGTVTVKVVDVQKHPQSGVYVYGCDQGNNNGYLSNAGSTDNNGMLSVPVRHDNTWYVGVSLNDQRLNPPPQRLDVLAQDGNVITLYPQGYRLRPYRVYGGFIFPNSTDYPQDYGFTLLGKGAGTASFTGSYPYYCIVAYDGEVLLDSIMGSNSVSYGVIATSLTLNEERIAGRQDGQYATVGDNDGLPTVGSVCVQPVRALTGITVIHPDQPYNAAQDWLLYDTPSAIFHR